MKFFSKLILISFLLCATELSGIVCAETTEMQMSKTLKSERFVRSMHDDRDLDFQVMEPTGPESKSKIYIKKNSHIAIDSKGNIYVTGPKWVTEEGFAANGISKISPTGAVTPMRLNISAGIEGIAVDKFDNIYLYEHYSSPSNAGRGGSEYSMFPAWDSLWERKSYSRIYKLTPDGNLKTFLGKNSNDLYYNFNVDSKGILYVGSYLGLKKIDPSFFGSTKVLLEYNNNPFSRFDQANPKTVFYFQPSITKTAMDGNDNLYYVERHYPNKIEMNEYGNLTEGSADGQPHAVIMRYSREGKTSVFAGINKSIGAVDGVGANAGFEQLIGLCIDDKGNLYTAEKMARTIRRIDQNGNAVTIATNIGNDVLDVAVYGNSLYILRKTGLDIIRKIDAIL